MVILGIETSCDETAVAIIDDERILAEEVYSQTVHAEYGGVVPELASRDHIKKLFQMVNRALASADIEPKHVAGIAVTAYPGLPGAVLAGISFAYGMSTALNIPLIKINHLEGHLFTAKFAVAAKPPFLALLVSGGHTEIILVEDWGRYDILGSTRDDAAGEAFDKVAQVLGLPYPGGPQIQALAETGNPNAIAFPRAMAKSDDLDFSFSGLKTAVINLLDEWGIDKVTKMLPDIAASFQEAVVDTLLNKVAVASKITGIKEIAIVGGVASNKRLKQKAEQFGYGLRIPPEKYCTDNGVMIAFAGHFHIKQGSLSSPVI